MLALPQSYIRDWVSSVLCLAFCAEQFVELSIDSLRIPPLGSLDEYGHKQRRQRRDHLPIE
jgi:hypothetical protein